MNLTRNQIIVIGVAFMVVVLIVLLFLGVLPGLKTGTNTSSQEVKLTAAGVLDQTAFTNLIDGYQKIRPNVKISYTQISEANYEKVLTDALASGSGPDILMFKNSWLPKHQNKITPADPNLFSLTQFYNVFRPKVVEQDFVRSGLIYALPLYVDTLALIYNKDIFDAKAVVSLPTTWTDFQNLIPKIREVSEQNQVVKPAAAIGGSEQSVSRASDILNLLMEQFGYPLLDSQGDIRLTFDHRDAFNFYLQFANPSSQYYTWSDNFKNSVDSFSEGKTAMLFNYAAAIPVIKGKNQYLNFGVAAMPQVNPGEPINFASYWGLAVSKQSRQPLWAWDFVVTATTDSTIVDELLKTLGESPATLTLINKYLDDPQIGVFAKQALTARSWPESDDNEVKEILSAGIKSVLSGRLTSQQAFEEIKNSIEDLSRPR